jgi:hypothetical protein
MNKEFITEIISRAVKDYGFRQVVLYNIEGINEYIETTEQIPSDFVFTQRFNRLISLE